MYVLYHCLSDIPLHWRVEITLIYIPLHWRVEITLKYPSALESRDNTQISLCMESRDNTPVLEITIMKLPKGQIGTGDGQYHGIIYVMVLESDLKI